MRIAVVGGGLRGLGAAFELAKAGVEVVLYEKEHDLGGHPKTVNIDGIDLDLDFMLFNRVSFPHLTALFDELTIDVEASDMSFSVSLDEGQGCEWGTRNGLRSLFARKSNVLKANFRGMLQEIKRFKDDAIMFLEELENNLDLDLDRTETLSDFITTKNYSEFFKKSYLIPLCAAIWSCSPDRVMDFSAFFVLSFYLKHNLLQVSGYPQWFTVKGCSKHYTNKLRKELENRGCHIRTSSKVHTISTSDRGCKLVCNDGSEHVYDECILAVPPPDAMDILGKEASYDEMRTLGALQYINRHLVPSVAASKALLELSNIQGKRGIWFCGVDHGYDFHEDGLKSSLVIANTILRRNFTPFTNPKQMVPSWKEAAARQFMIIYLKRFISAGCLIFLEEGGSVLMFEGSDKRCTWKCTVKIHNAQFYWKVAMEADLGLADVFVNGDISMVDKNEGLLNLFLVLLANLYIYPKDSTDNKSINFKGWWTPMFFTAGIASAKYFWQHYLRRNTITQARQNIARHYDMSNEMFSFFLDETMIYSCAISKSEDEDLKVAQLRKLHLLIDKARVQKHHHVLEIGCGWGSLAIEIVKKTGCRYTGITLSKEQVKFAQNKVKAAGLETISVPDERFDGHKRSTDFLREYIFPGGSLPSLNRLTSAMAAASRLSVEHVETIGPHYYKTLRCWRKAFLENQSNIRSLGFDDKFMRVWEYYFDYAAAAFKTRVLGNYQIVFTRQANIFAFNDPYVTTPSSHSCS